MFISSVNYINFLGTVLGLLSFFFQEKIGWFVQENSSDMLSCITHTENLQLWTSDGAYPFLQFSRDKICHAMQVTLPLKLILSLNMKSSLKTVAGIF